VIGATRVVPVGLLLSYAREVLDGDSVLSDVWVEGEVSNLFRAQSGHVYFSLRGGADEGQIKCALFRPFAARQRSLPRPGELIAAHGRVTVYERDGALQLYVDVLERAGIGLAALQLEQLRQRLADEGLFDEARRRPLPRAPRVIGVVTSPDGAVWHDIRQVVRRRYPLTHLVLAPAAVQGEGAGAALVAALRAIQDDGRAEVVILARGGGSAEDLAAFNDEAVVRAVFACRVPVVTGVGHETDRTLADDAADLRAPTPSAAAELCVPSVVDLLDQAGRMGVRLKRAIDDVVEDERQRLTAMGRDLLRVDLRRSIDHRREATAALSRRSGRTQRQRLEATSALLGARAELLRALDPVAVLERGYAVLADATGSRSLTSARAAAAAGMIRAEMWDGAIVARVERRGSGGRERALPATTAGHAAP
jgi:exodeoxyribonuclease VII large subunit